MTKIHSKKELEETRESAVVAANESRMAVLTLAARLHDHSELKKEAVSIAAMYAALRWTIVDAKHLNPERIGRHFELAARAMNRATNALGRGDYVSVGRQLGRIVRALRESAKVLEGEMRRLLDARKALELVDGGKGKNGGRSS